jgi:alpha-L-rhamnosidase
MKKGFEQGDVFCRLCAAIALLFFLFSGCWSTERKKASSSSANVVQSQSFISAKPIWPAGRDREMNLFVGFRAAFKKPVGGKAVLRITGSTVYRIFLNGNFVGYGPARAAHGYYRVDEWGLGDLGNENIVAIEAAGYNVNSYYLLDQPAFVQAEVVADGQVLASTAGKGAFFEASILKERVQKVQRYSFQRPFSEYYRLGEGFDQWRRDRTAHFEKVKCAVPAAKKLLCRRVPYPEFLLRQPVCQVSRGGIEAYKPERLWRDRSLTEIGPKLKGFRVDDLEIVPSIELQKIQSTGMVDLNEAYYPGEPFVVGEKSFRILDFGTNLTGFVGAEVQCRKKARLFVTFDEILSNNDVDFKRLSCVNIVGYELQPGLYNLESFEPYTMRYLKISVFEGDCEIKNVFLREYVNPDVAKAQFACSDRRLNEIFEAGRETFRQNAVDVFTDCPSRERAGWLMDSLRTAAVEYDLTGTSTVEKNFFENYLLAPKLEQLPEGMPAMCYPADHYDGVFIPNWAMWFAIELDEYLQRSGDRQLVDALKPKVMALFDYLKGFENEDGLLENLKSWIFVEWSPANQFVQNVNFPTNMLYAETLATAGRMYNQPELVEKAKKLRAVIGQQSFDGEFFVDNAVRKNGKLEPTRNRTESCQDYAFFFGIADPNTHKELWERFRTQFGPDRVKKGLYPEIHPANAMIGNWMRLEVLSRYGLCRQLTGEFVDYYLYMAERTGTLWENTGSEASCNHGFASHVVHFLYRDVLGVYRIDQQEKAVELRFSDVAVEWCQGRLPTRDGFVFVKWFKDGDKVKYKIDVPAGYKVKVENRTGLEVVCAR